MKRLTSTVALCALACAAAAATSCGHGASFDNTPLVPPHSDSEDGAKHARGKDYPFLCRDNSAPNGYALCKPGARPPDDRLSCDALGCHGSYDYGAGRDLAFRTLGGSEGPSCYTCHGKEWREAGRDPSVPIDLTRLVEDDD